MIVSCEGNFASIPAKLDENFGFFTNGEVLCLCPFLCITLYFDTNLSKNGKIVFTQYTISENFDNSRPEMHFLIQIVELYKNALSNLIQERLVLSRFKSTALLAKRLDM